MNLHAVRSSHCSQWDAHRRDAAVGDARCGGRAPMGVDGAQRIAFGYARVAAMSMTAKKPTTTRKSSHSSPPPPTPTSI
jgi:hypothetical protein